MIVMLINVSRINIIIRTSLNKRTIMTSLSSKAEKAAEELKVNPFYGKYAEKIAKLQKTSPEEFLKKISDAEAKKRGEGNEFKRQYSQLLNPKNTSGRERNVSKESLDKYMKVDSVKAKTRDEIEQIWQKYHLQKDCSIAATVPKKDYEEFRRKAELYPTFLFPLPRSQGYEFMMSQIEGDCVHFTPLLYYQVHKENAPECLTIKHYTEFMEEKEIVLMKGEFDKNIIDSKEALCLANQLQLYYCQNYESKNCLLEQFTKKPDEFKHMNIIREIESLTL